MEQSDLATSRRLLRARCERPRRRAAEQRNEIAASQFSEALLAAQLHLTRCRKTFFTADHFGPC